MRIPSRLLPGIIALAWAAQPLLAQMPASSQADLKADAVLALFQEISAIPRCSGHEEQIGAWLEAWGKNHGFKVEGDAAGNVFIWVPASQGCEQRPPIILQSHMDMVCEKAEGAVHDFSKDAVRLQQEGDWIRANGTSLGADDGIGMALALSIAQDPALPHPPLELMFTTGEETTSKGVEGLAPKHITGRMLVNLDSEQEGVLVIGDATASISTITTTLKSEPLPPAMKAFTLRVEGLKGGHSGTNITKPRANAIQVAARGIQALQKAMEVRVIGLQGGTARNSIPRSVDADIALPATQEAAAIRLLEALQASLRKDHATEDPALVLRLSPASDPAPASVFRKDESLRLISLLLALPCGVRTMDPRFPGIPESSNSLGTIRTAGTTVTVVSMNRGSRVPPLVQLADDLRDKAAAWGAQAICRVPEAPWLTRPDSALVRQAQTTYARVFERAPVVSLVHGGLECGDIARKVRDLATLSVGPTIENAHSPAERVSVASIQRLRIFLAALLADLK